MRPPFVKKFDFRGIYNKDIFDEDAYFLGCALQKVIKPKKVLIGWDTRPASRTLAEQVISALDDAEVSYLDRCPIDYVTVAANAFDFDLSIMLTGSHNPQNWTGLLMHTKGGDSIQGELVEQIIEGYYEAKKDHYEKKGVNIDGLKNFKEEIEKTYEEKIKSIFALEKIGKLKVLVDVGDGSGSMSLTLLEKLLPQVEFTRINDRNIYDENSSHVADPSNLENMNNLIERMKSEQFDCGFAFDSDADRVLATDETGEYINGSLLGSAHIEILVELGLPDKIFGYAVDCGTSVYNAILDLKNKGKDISSQAIPVGRSLIRRQIREGKLDLGIENVGHFYSKDFFMTDSGLFSLLVTLSWLAQNGPLSSLKHMYPDGFRDQIFSETVTDETIEDICQRINQNFHEAPTKIEVDGTRYEFYENERLKTWYTIRKSGYENITKCYFGSLDRSDFELLKRNFEEISKPQESSEK